MSGYTSDSDSRIHWLAEHVPRDDREAEAFARFTREHLGMRRIDKTRTRRARLLTITRRLQRAAK